jgi:Raf kinase inhibitor-like protein, YbhB/YbcL family
MTQAINVKSDAFKDGGLIPWENGKKGQNISPQLSWDTAQGVKSWALIADDPDAPSGTFTHWVLFNLPGNKTNLPPGASGTKDQLEGATEGQNSTGSTKYTGPNPPSGTHRYFFKIYGLDSPLDLGENATKEHVLAEMDKHKKLAEGQIMGRYSAESGQTAKGAIPRG